MSARFVLQGDNSGWEIVDTLDPVMPCGIASISGQLIDGSGTGQWPGGFIRTREQREVEARFVVNALNLALEHGLTLPVLTHGTKREREYRPVHAGWPFPKKGAA